MATITVLDASGNPVDIELPLTSGRKVASLSKPSVLSTEDKAVLDDIAAKLATMIAIGEDGVDVAAASGTPQPLGGAPAAGDRMIGILVKPTTTAALGAISIRDGVAGGDVVIFAGGDIPSIIPFFIPWSAVAANDGWHLTTGAGASVRAQGNFS